MIPDYQSLMLPVIRAAAAGEVSVSATIEQIARELELSDDERRQLSPSGKQAIFCKSGSLGENLLGASGIAVNDAARPLQDYRRRP
jgi:restriction system protein